MGFAIVLAIVLLPVAVAHLLTALALAAMTTGVLVPVAAWESVALRRPARETSRMPT